MKYIQIEITFKFEHQIRFSREFTIQYITMLFTYEHNQILFHSMPHHDGSHYEKINCITIHNANPIMNSSMQTQLSKDIPSDIFACPLTKLLFKFTCNVIIC